MLTTLERTLYFILVFSSLAIAIRIFIIRFAIIQQGRTPSDELKQSDGGWQRVLVYIVGQWSLLKNIRLKDLAGLQHVIIFWCSPFFLVSYFLAIIAGDAVGLGSSVRNSVFSKLIILFGDIAGLSIFIGLCWGLLRRTILRPKRLGPDYEATKFFLIVLGAFSLFIAYYILEATRLNLEFISWVGPISAICAQALNRVVGGNNSQEALFSFFWWMQTLVSIGFILYVSLSSHQHPFFAPLTIFRGPHQPRGRLAKIALNDSYSSILALEDFEHRQLTELYACTQCGRCQDACPATATAKPLSPKLVIQKLRDNMDAGYGLNRFWQRSNGGQGNGQVPMSQGISDNELWSCTTCMACIQSCPVFVSALDKIIALRRDRVLVKSQFFAEVTNLFNDTETFGDTFGKGKAFREDWLMGKDVKVLKPSEKVDTLFWVGCLGSFHDRTKIVAAAFVDLLKTYDSNFAILGKAELCCADPIRRLGNEYLFQKLARKNIEVLNDLHFNRIVTYCPHCYNTLKNEYLQLGGKFEVFHYTELLDAWIQREPIKWQRGSNLRIVFQDPCYLARANSLFSAPRDILESIVGVKPLEAANTRENTFCCGGGGGQMWVRETEGERINDVRLKQLTARNPDVIATACPYCMVMMEDGLKSLPGFETLQCRDLIEIVQGSIS